MTGFTLPFGMFQIHFPDPAVAHAVGTLRKVLDDHNILLEEIYAESPDEFPPPALFKRGDEFAASIQAVGKASKRFQEALRTIEFPEVLPSITSQLIFASVVAQAFHLSFEVVDYERHDDQKGPSYWWWVTGRITDRHDRSLESTGTSFLFDKDDDKMAEGALLSACADAFIHCVFTAVPHFPWDRWSIERLENPPSGDG